MAIAGFGKSTIRYDMFDLVASEREAKRLAKCENIYHRGQHLAWNGKELLDSLLEQYRAGRVMFDSRPIYQGDREHPELLAARHKKPQVPLLDTVYSDLVYARVVLHPDPKYNTSFVDEWLQRTSDYLDAGHMDCPW